MALQNLPQDYLETFCATAPDGSCPDLFTKTISRHTYLSNTAPLTDCEHMPDRLLPQEARLWRYLELYRLRSCPSERPCQAAFLRSTCRRAMSAPPSREAHLSDALTCTLHHMSTALRQDLRENRDHSNTESIHGALRNARHDFCRFLPALSCSKSTTLTSRPCSSTNVRARSMAPAVDARTVDDNAPSLAGAYASSLSSTSPHYHFVDHTACQHDAMPATLTKQLLRLTISPCSRPLNHIMVACLAGQLLI